MILEKQFCQFARELFFIEGGYWYCCRTLFLEAWESNKAFFFSPDHPIIFNRFSTNFMPLVSSYTPWRNSFSDIFRGYIFRGQLHEMGKNTWTYINSIFLLVLTITNTTSLKLSIKLQIKIIHGALLCEY